MLDGSFKKKKKEIESGQEVTVIRAENVSELKKDINPKIEKANQVSHRIKTN